MALVVPDQGENIALKALLNHTAGQNLILKLYTNNKTPAEADTEADYTEASGSGYASKTLTDSSWTVSGGTATYAAQTFTFTGALGNVYGYFLVQASSGLLVYAERFTGAPFVIATNGDSIVITPSISAS